jgi:hypothetical protein
MARHGGGGVVPEITVASGGGGGGIAYPGGAARAYTPEPSPHQVTTASSPFLPSLSRTPARSMPSRSAFHLDWAVLAHSLLLLLLGEFLSRVSVDSVPRSCSCARGDCRVGSLGSAPIFLRILNQSTMNWGLTPVSIARTSSMLSCSCTQVHVFELGFRCSY